MTGTLRLDIPPGVFRNGTRYQARGRWYDSQLVRHRSGALTAIGGWETAKDLIAFVAQDANDIWQFATTPFEGDGTQLTDLDIFDTFAEPSPPANFDTHTGDTNIGTWQYGTSTDWVQETDGNVASQTLTAIFCRNSQNNARLLSERFEATGWHGRASVDNVNFACGINVWASGAVAASSTVRTGVFIGAVRASSSTVDFRIIRYDDTGSVVDNFLIASGIAMGLSTTWAFGAVVEADGVTLTPFSTDFATMTRVDYSPITLTADIRDANHQRVGLSAGAGGSSGRAFHRSIEFRFAAAASGLPTGVIAPDASTPPVNMVDNAPPNPDAVFLRLVGNQIVTGSNEIRALLGWRIDNVRSLAIGANDALYQFAQGVTTNITPPDLVGGDEDTQFQVGIYGSGAYGDGLYGTGDEAESAVVEAATWQLDNFGEDLVATLTSDGRLLHWDASAGGVAQPIANAPINNDGLVVTPESFLVALGAGGDPRLLQWASQETLTVWAPLTTNTAGDFPLQTNGVLMCGRRLRNETLVLTSVDAYAMRYIGGALVYQVPRVGSNCGIISRHAIATLDHRAVWMGDRSFFIYDGSVRVLLSDVHDYVFSDFNFNQKSKVFAFPNSTYGEVWFFYPSASSDENDRYVIWNYEENHWHIGQLARSAGIDAGAFESPIMSDLNRVYHHERGTSRTGVAQGPFIESGPIEIGQGERVFCVQEIIPDEATQDGQVLGSLQMFMYSAFHPSETEVQFGPFSLANPTSTRLTGRQVRVRMEEIVPGGWRLGNIRLKGDPGGDR